MIHVHVCMYIVVCVPPMTHPHTHPLLQKYMHAHIIFSQPKGLMAWTRMFGTFACTIKHEISVYVHDVHVAPSLKLFFCVKK